MLLNVFPYFQSTGSFAAFYDLHDGVHVVITVSMEELGDDNTIGGRGNLCLHISFAYVCVFFCT